MAVGPEAEVGAEADDGGPSDSKSILIIGTSVNPGYTGFRDTFLQDIMICRACSAPVVLQYTVMQSYVRLQLALEDALKCYQKDICCSVSQYSDVRLNASYIPYVCGDHHVQWLFETHDIYVIHLRLLPSSNAAHLPAITCFSGSLRLCPKFVPWHVVTSDSVCGLETSGLPTSLLAATPKCLPCTVLTRTRLPAIIQHECDCHQCALLMTGNCILQLVT